MKHILGLLLLLPTVKAFFFFGSKNQLQPSGLTINQITSLAQKRYGVNNPENDKPMLGKTAVITGAAGGIGRELSSIMHRLGGTVIAMDRNETGLNELKETLDQTTFNNGKNENRIIMLPTHHEDLASVAQSAEQIISQFDCIDLLVNNAGISYPLTSTPGDSKLKSKHGMDLAFTINYLSHVLLVEKLKPVLTKSSHSRIVHVTSTYHWKVNGSELIPDQYLKSPKAYQSDPSLQVAQHITRSYANTKLAQLWHSRSITNCTSVCACPTWVATNIGGEDARDFLERFAFPVSGAGITSTLNAIFRTEDELGDALNGGTSFVANSKIAEYLPLKSIWTSRFVTQLGWRDPIVDFFGLILLLAQRFTHDDFIVQQSSPESYNNKEGMDNFHRWSLNEVKPYL